jgi:zinc protease
VSFTISAPVQADRTGDSIRALRAHLADFAGPKGVTPEELTRIINSNTRELPGSFESSGDLLAGLSNIVNLGRPDDWYEGLAQKYAGMTASSLDGAARAMINPADIVWVVVGDAKQVRGQLDGIGLPVEELPVPKGD